MGLPYFFFVFKNRISGLLEQDYKICARRMECKALRFFKSCNPVSVITIGRGLIFPSPQFFVLPLHALD